MFSNNSRRIADLLIWTGFVMIMVGCALAYPFVRDTLAQSDPSAALSFVVTLAPAPMQPAVLSVTSTSLPVQSVVTLATSTPASTPTLGPTDLPSPTPASATPTIAPTPIVLPDNNVSSGSNLAAPAKEPTPATTGTPPDRIVIPAIDLDAPVIVVGWHVEQIKGAAASVWDVPDQRAAGWLKTSAPAGQPGNTVLDGHHNIRGQVFKQLVDLKPNDAIDLYAGGTVYRYAVTEKHILRDRDQPMPVRIANAQWIQPTTDERLTLVTCWPFTNNTHRLIIVARPLPAPPPARQGGKAE
jgi:sortase A